MLTTPRAFLLLMLPSSEQTGGMRKKMRVDPARTGDSKRPERYSIPFDIVLRNKGWGKEGRGMGMLSSQVNVRHDGALLS